MPIQDAKPRPYHHGNLRQVLLESAEQILQEEGVQGLKLRAIARRAGVSHTAADPHFGDLTGLLSELAAVGHERLHAAMTGRGGEPRPMDIARGYIGFARENPHLFGLMFRSEALDITRPRLQQAVGNSYLALASTAGDSLRPDALSLADGGRLVAAWALVHGLAMLLIDNRLRPIQHRIVPEPELDALIEAAFRSLSFD